MSLQDFGRQSGARGYPWWKAQIITAGTGRCTAAVVGREGRGKGAHPKTQSSGTGSPPAIVKRALRWVGETDSSNKRQLASAKAALAPPW